MSENEIKESRNEVSRIVKKPVENVYGLASLYRVLFARMIDLLIAAIPPIICIWAWRPPTIANGSTPDRSDWIFTIVQLAIGLASILIFFVVIPSFTKGTTIGKGLTGIRLKRSKGDKKVKWYMLLARESFFLLIPWAVALAAKCIALAVLLNSNHSDNTGSVGAQVINQLGWIFYFLWFVFLLATIKAQSEHQSGIDMHFGLFVVYKEPVKQITEDVEVKETSVILTDEPGNLSKENLDELRNDEKRKFSKSISLEDLDIEVTKEQIESKKKNDQKKIESKKNKDDKKGEKK